MADEPGGAASGAVLDALWHQLLAGWEDPAAHAAFLRVAQESGRLADAAMRYRGMRGDPQRSERAEVQLSAIAVLAFAALEATRTAPPPKRRVGGILALVMGIFFVVALFFLARALYR